MRELKGVQHAQLPRQSRLARGAELAYRAVTDLRNALYDKRILPSYKSSIPVISVGNVTVGGTGKSPFTQFLVESLVDIGRRPAILSRGYGGSAKGPRFVQSDDTADLVGDEPLMHKRFFLEKVPVIVSRRRSRGARMLEHVSGERPDTIVLDDGFQHRALARDLDIVLVDADEFRSGAGWEEGRLLPVGRLRERPTAALRRIQLLVLITRRAETIDRRLQHYFIDLGFNSPILHARIAPRNLRDQFDQRTYPLQSLKGKSVVALSAIARPEQFRAHLDQAGALVKAECVFPDHSAIDSEDVERAVSLGYPVIVTAKDMVKISKPAASGKILVMDVKVSFEAGDQERFQEILRLWSSAHLV